MNTIFFLNILISILTLVTPQAIAQTPAQFSAFQYCEKERKQLCADKETFVDLGSCLLGHKAELSTLCQQDIDRFIHLREQAASRAGGALSSFGGPNNIGPPVPLITYEGRLSPAKNSPPSVLKNGGSISGPVSTTNGKTISLSLAGSDFHFGSPLTLDSFLTIVR